MARPSLRRLWNTSRTDIRPVVAFGIKRWFFPLFSEQALAGLSVLHDHHHDHSQCDHASHGKHIYIYSPSSAVRDKAAFKRGIGRLRSQGHDVEVDVDALATHTRFAGDDATRLAAIHRAAASGADVALISRGGYGLTRILPGIRYKAVAKAIEKGTRFVGVSDFTAFQLAVLAKTGATTWAGPSLGADFGVDAEPDDIMQACFDDLLTGQGEGTGWRMNKEQLNAATGKPAVPNVYVKSATLWGGNLAVLASLVGTPHFPAIVLGQFTNFKLAPHDKGYKLQTVVDWLRTQIKAPVLTNLPFGHVQTKVLLPVGSTVSLSVEDRDALIYWGHQH